MNLMSPDQLARAALELPDDGDEYEPPTAATARADRIAEAVQQAEAVRAAEIAEWMRITTNDHNRTQGEDHE